MNQKIKLAPDQRIFVQLHMRDLAEMVDTVTKAQEFLDEHCSCSPDLAAALYKLGLRFFAIGANCYGEEPFDAQLAKLRCEAETDTVH